MVKSPNPRHKPSLLDIPPEGATASTMGRIWGVSAEVAALMLSRFSSTQVYRFWKRTESGYKAHFWKRVEEKNG